MNDRLAAIEQGLTDRKVAADTLWVLVTAFLVFWMNAGFALVESGMCRAKNAVNILSKNFIVFAVSSLAFYFVGWGIMFGDGNGFAVGCTDGDDDGRRQTGELAVADDQLRDVAAGEVGDEARGDAVGRGR
jgi:hypothetical protein